MSKESGRKSPWKCQSQAEISGKLPTSSHIIQLGQDSIEANMLRQTLTFVGWWCWTTLAMLIGIVSTGPHNQLRQLVTANRSYFADLIGLYHV